MQETARPLWESTRDTAALQQFLKDQGCHGVDAVLVTMGLLNCELGEAQRAFMAAPCREAERQFHNQAVEPLWSHRWSSTR
ncbi:hypothetical protein ABZZ79_36150 [Streptomyces sp. NPDC006458]|uniref:hypothetical protein n=1 Tax=Streptomyces sp. NPDC006458 TaxID=3154302 RepID=UPI0033ADD85F